MYKVKKIINFIFISTNFQKSKIKEINSFNPYVNFYTWLGLLHSRAGAKAGATGAGAVR
jgi:hypothetical protein